MPVARARLPAGAIVATMLTTGALALVLVGLAALLKEPLLVPPFATSAAIIACLPESPVAQPRHVLGGHLLGALSGYLTLMLGAGVVVNVTLSVTLAVGAMLAARMLHPPAAATAAIVVLESPSVVAFLIVLALVSTLITLIGMLSARANAGVTYPQYWW